MRVYLIKSEPVSKKNRDCKFGSQNGGRPSELFKSREYKNRDRDKGFTLTWRVHFPLT